jgi:hypothetical protein
VGGSGGDVQFKRQYDHTLMEEEHEEESVYPRDTHPDLYEEHVGMTASMLQHHIAPLVHESFSVAELTSERVEEALEEVLYHQASGVCPYGVWDGWAGGLREDGEAHRHGLKRRHLTHD